MWLSGTAGAHGSARRRAPRPGKMPLDTSRLEPLTKHPPATSGVSSSWGC